MPAFEGDDIPIMKELMDEEAKQEFLAKRKRVEERREKEIEELESAFKSAEVIIDGGEMVDCDACFGTGQGYDAHGKPPYFYTCSDCGGTGLVKDND